MEAVPQIVANCKILSKLGQGGMGTVFRSVHVTLGRRMAIKILPPEFTRSPEYVSRFLREARAIANLNHPNIVLVHDAGEQNGIYYIAMELVDGASLAAVTRHCSRLPEPVALDFLEQAAQGLGYAHERGLVHRDIKPENLLINREGTLKVVDFGLVLEAASQSHLTRTGTFLGTPTFMSPEQCDGDVADTRSDLYALGATFYCILTGRAPFSATTALGIMYKHKFEAPPPLDEDTSAQTCAIILKLLAKKREDRYQTAKELIADVDNALRTVPPKTDWSLDEVLAKVAPPHPEPTAEELTRSSRVRVSSETVAMREKEGVAPSGPGSGEFPSAGPASPPASAATQTPSAPSKTASAWDPTIITSRTPAPPGATPAPSPLPGTITPAPASGASRTGLWVGLAAVVLMGVGLGSYFFYRNYRQSQLQGYVESIENLHKHGDLDEAMLQIRLALQSYPNEQKLDALLKTIGTELEEGKKLKEKELKQAGRNEGVLASRAKSALDEKKYDDAIRSFKAALQVNPDSEEAKSGLRDANFEKLKMLVAGAEKGKTTWVDALSQARECLNYGGSYEEVERLEQRLKIEDLRKDALRLSNNRDLLAAADKFDEAANFSTRDATLRDELLQFASQQRTQHYLNLATEAEGQRKWTAAIAALNNALKLAPKDTAIEKRLENARTAFRNETSFESAMALGRKAMDAQRWAEATEMYRAAVGHNKDHAEAKTLLAEAQNRDVLGQVDTKVQAKLWRESRTMLDQIQADIGKMPQAAVKIEYERLSTLVQTSLDEIARKETRAQAAAKDGPLLTAIQEYESLIELNPTDRANYEKALGPIRVEHAFREFLADGDAQSKAGQFAKARAAYQQAKEKKKGDAAAEATVGSKLALLVASEKLFKIEPLIADKNWAEARTQLAAIQKEIPADNKEASAAVAASVKTVDEALAKINSMEETGKTAVANHTWDEGRKALSQLMELNPSKKDAYQQQLNDLEIALKAFNERAARQARYDKQMIDAKQKLGQEDFDGATAAGQEALKDMPGDPTATAMVKDAQATKAAKAAAATELENAKRSVASASKTLDDGAKLVAEQAPPDARPLQRSLQTAKEQLAQQEAGAAQQFTARSYNEARTAAAKLTTGAAGQTRASMESVATEIEKLGVRAASATVSQQRRTVGEIGLDDPAPTKADASKAVKYNEVARALRDLAAGLR